MKPYDHKKIESKWQKKWFSSNIYKAKTGDKREKFFGLIEFPFPSGEGLHIGHVRSNTAMDIITRKRRMQNYNVLYPIGWDSFGLPTENYAIKTGIAPQIVTKKNTANFRRQLKAMGFGFDWSREIDTSDPKYYKWTQWIFLQLLKQGLAYKKKIAVNWCPKDKTGLANEEVIDGCCERCGTKVERREKEQWILAITKYAERLHSELDATQFEERIKIQQRNWIGKSEGALINFKLENNSEQISVFTTRPDTIFGVSYVVLAPEHELVSKLLPNIKNQQEVLEYVARAKETDEITRSSEDGQKTGVALQGVFAVNCANGQRVPVWIADYVLAHYGTGAVMAVPAHDTRDHSFAKKYSLPVVPVIEGGNGEQAYTGDGTLINSGQFNGKNNKDATKEILSWIGATPQVTFKLRDWVFSRQRYWGEPIPVVHCAKCGIVPVPEKDLPLKLPKVKNFQPTDSGESPLALATKWVNTKCPQCKGRARRETDTMPNWAGSSWYYLRYADTKNSKQLASKEALSYWNPVDWYNGGMEHTTLHLLYSRFWHKFLFDLGIVPTSEAYMKRTSHGMIAGEGGVKMSKSIGNVISPDSIVEPLGADTLRVYEMFMGPFSQGVSWNTDAIAGSRRFIERVWKMQDNVSSSTTDSKDLLTTLHQTIAKISAQIEALEFNTCISSLMILLNKLEEGEKISAATWEIFLKLLAPFAPHVTEELWSKLKHKSSIHTAPWPVHDPALLVSDMVKIAVQINGKTRAVLETTPGQNDEQIRAISVSHPDISKWIAGKTITRVIVVKDKLINIVISD